MANQQVTVDAGKYADEDDCLTAAAEDYASEHGLEGWDLAPRWQDNQREAIVLTVPEWSVKVGCECGKWSGVACEWCGPKSETVVVEYMPERHRASHKAAGNSGVYPHNGAVRIRVERSCADRIIEDAGDWASVVS